MGRPKCGGQGDFNVHWYAPHARRAAYLMVPADGLAPFMISELDPELLPLVKQRKLTRCSKAVIKGLLCLRVHSERT